MVGTALPRAAARLLALALLAGALAPPALAQTITFSPLSGANGDPYTGHAENGFFVGSVIGDFHEAHVFGNPVPAIFGGPIGAPIEGTFFVNRAGGALFTFHSVDLSSNSAPGTSFVFGGFRNNSLIIAQAGVIGSVDTFETILHTNPGIEIDLLRIILTPAPGVTSYNVDNIVLGVGPAVVPEPATVALFATGALAIAGMARRRSRR